MFSLIPPPSQVWWSNTFSNNEYFLWKILFGENAANSQLFGEVMYIQTPKKCLN